MIFLYLAGAAVLSLFATTGCSKEKKSTQDQFPKEALNEGEPAPLCPGNGYTHILQNLSKALADRPGQEIPLDSFAAKITFQPCIMDIFENPQRAALAQRLLRDIASKDGKKDSLSAYDFLVGSYQLFNNQWKENGAKWFFQKREYFSLNDQIRILAEPLSDPQAPKELARQSRDLLQSLSVYLNKQPAEDPNRATLPLFDYVLTGKEPEASQYLKKSFGDFIRLDDPAKASLFAEMVAAEFPSEEATIKMATLLNSSEMGLFTRACFKSQMMPSFSLFENLHSRGISLPTAECQRITDEAEFFPNLPQDTPYPQRQKAIDEFLGPPALELKKTHAIPHGKAIQTTIKKYYWIGETEIFSIESGKPGPTTLVFAPHFHEDNPRKIFHWIKEIPLQTGRILLMPEANRYLGMTGGNTRPMNDIFNEALGYDRMDYLLVRKTEYLMGLVDGLIGLHDWQKMGPFFISDVIKDAEGHIDPNKNPAPSPWVPEEVKDIQSSGHVILPEGEWERVANEQETQGVGKNPQTQWKIAEYAANRLEQLAGARHRFVVSTISDKNSSRADNATAYMNYFLKKPAMTFEGLLHEEQGQLLAQATYSLLLGFGHQVHPQFEELLKTPNPIAETQLYVGLPIGSPDAASPEHPRLP